MKTIYFHIGLPKTGTSTIQHLSVAHHHALKEQRLYYPTKNLTNNRHQYLVRGLIEKNLSNTQGELARWEKELNQKDDVLLSAEGLSNHFYDFPKNSLVNFRRLFDPYHTVGILFLRDKQTWIRSYYKQNVVNPPVPDTYYACKMQFEEFAYLPKVQSFFTDFFLEDLKKGYGFDELKLIQFEKKWSNQLPEIFDRFPQGSFQTTRKNTSLSSGDIEIIRRINSFDLPIDVRNNIVEHLFKGYFTSKNTDSFAIKKMIFDMLNQRQLLRPEIIEYLSHSL